MPLSPATQHAARALGWTSLVIAVLEIAAPNWLCEQFGLDGSPALVRALGAREAAAGLGILAARDPAPGVWARVAGDAMDAALLGAAASRTSRPRGLAVAAALVAAVTVLDVLCAVRLQRPATASETPYRAGV
jgi:hypothetical protein